MKFQAPMPCRQMSDLPEKQAGLIHSLPSHAVLHVTAPGLAVPVLLFSYPVLLILAYFGKEQRKRHQARDDPRERLWPDDQTGSGTHSFTHSCSSWKGDMAGCKQFNALLQCAETKTPSDGVKQQDESQWAQQGQF